MEFWIPYGPTEVPIRVPDDNFYKILEPPKAASSKDPTSLVTYALETPVGGTSLTQLAKRGGKAGIVVDPLVPAVFVRATIETLRAQLGRLGIDRIVVFLRKRTSNLSQPEGLGTVVVEACPSQGPFIEIGSTSSGTPVQLRNEFIESNVRICLGFVAPHFASGFTGGPDAILPGVSSMETVAKNRSMLLRTPMTSPDTVWGPVLRDTLEACKLAAPIFAISFVPDGWGGVDSVFSGDLEPTFKEATNKYGQIHKPAIDRKADIAILSAGAILGMDLYHSVRILSNAREAVKKDGTLVLTAECSRGIGDQRFQDFSKRFEDRKALSMELRHHFALGAHVALFLKDAVEHNRVQLVSVLPDHYTRVFDLKSAKTVSAAVQSSIRAEGKDAKVLILPHGDLTLPVVQSA